jgi:hypothetical protein
MVNQPRPEHLKEKQLATNCTNFTNHGGKCMGGPPAASDGPSRRREFSFLLRLELSLGQRFTLPPIPTVKFVKLVAAFFHDMQGSVGRIALA